MITSLLQYVLSNLVICHKVFDFIIEHKWIQLAISFSRQNSRARPPSPAAMKQRPPSPQPMTAKPPPIQKPALTPTGPPTLRKRDSKSKDLCPVQALSPQSSDSSKSKDKDGEQLPVKRLQFKVKMSDCT